MFPIVHVYWDFPSGTVPIAITEDMNPDNVIFTQTGTRELRLQAETIIDGETVLLSKLFQFLVIDLDDAFPDAVFSEAHILPAISVPEGLLTMNWRIKNVGYADMMLNNVSYFISQDSLLDSLDYQLPVTETDYHNVVLDPTRSFNYSRILQMPENISLGMYWVLAKFYTMDGQDDLFEQNISNNFVALPLEIEAELPDYIVSNVTSNHLTIDSGEELELGFDIVNIGYQVYTSGCSNYRCFLSRDTILSIDDSNFWEGTEVLGQGCVYLGGSTLYHVSKTIGTQGWLGEGLWYVLVVFDHSFYDIDGDIIEMNELNNLSYIPVTVYNPYQPTVQASGLSVVAHTSTSVDLRWQRGNGEKCIVIATAEDGSFRRPIDDIVYAANSSWPDAGPIWDDDDLQWRNNSRVVYAGTGNAVTVSNLDADKTWYFSVFEFNESSLDYMPRDQETVCTHLNSAVNPATWYVHFRSGEANPYGITINAMEFSPTGTMSAVSNNGYLLRSADDGMSFSLDHISDLDLNKYLSLAQTHMICASFGGDIVLSHDAGSVWKTHHLSSDYGISRIFELTQFADSVIFITCLKANESKGYLYRSLDYGESWQELVQSDEHLYSMLIDGSNMLLVGELGTQYASYDHGSTWIEQTSNLSGSYNLLQARRLAGGSYIALSDDLVYESRNDGATWQTLITNTTHYLDYQAIAEVSSSQIYILDDYHVLHSQPDTSLEWESIDLSSLPSSTTTSRCVNTTASRVWVGGVDILSHPHVFAPVIQYRDSDLDGYGDTSDSLYFMGTFPGWVTTDGDCDDNNFMINPGVLEICDGIDNQCNGVIDEGVTMVIYRDMDNDGYGVWNDTVISCVVLPGYASIGGDCDDQNNLIYPGAYELCDNLDNDCNGEVDESILILFYEDVDQDGYGNTEVSELHVMCESVPGFVQRFGDCDDQDPNLHPNSLELCNGIDDDCNGLVDDGIMIRQFRDVDGDGYGDQGELLVDCVLHTGYVLDSLDCNDHESTVYPGAIEFCDYFDNDCDGLIDEDFVCTNGSLSVEKSWVEVGEQLYFNFSSVATGVLPKLVIDGTEFTLPSYSGTYSTAIIIPGLYQVSLKKGTTVLGKLFVIVANGLVTPILSRVEGDTLYDYCDVQSDGQLHLDQNLVPSSQNIHMKYLIMYPFGVDGDDCRLMMRLNNSQAIGGQGNYQIRVDMLGDAGKAYLSVATHSPYRYLGANNLTLSTSSQLYYQSWEGWKEFGFETRGNNTMKYHSTTSPSVTSSKVYPGHVGNLYGILIDFSGNGAIDWLQLYNGNEELVWESNFDTCAQFPSLALQVYDGIQLSLDHFAASTRVNVMQDLHEPMLWIFPNPAKQLVTISSTQVLSTVTLYRVTGELLFIESIDTDTFGMDISSYSSGVYLLRAQDWEGILPRENW
ncbi:MAG: T9SS type A sorting domain-containing protein [Candidatus Peribacteria bacterium]|nr:MAG: T9SS type A sorting domain-containing protein [Candidatus Peribacteria bacterium]